MKVTPNLVVLLPCLRDRMPPRGTWTRSRSANMGISWGLIRPSARCCSWARAAMGINTGWGMNGPRAAWPRAWGCWWMIGWTWPGHVHLQARQPNASKAVWPAVEGGGSASLLWRDSAWSAAPSSRILSIRRTWTYWSSLEDAHEDGQKMVKNWHKLPREVVDVSSLGTFNGRLDRALSNQI